MVAVTKTVPLPTSVMSLAALVLPCIGEIHSMALAHIVPEVEFAHFRSACPSFSWQHYLRVFRAMAYSLDELWSLQTAGGGTDHLRQKYK